MLPRWKPIWMIALVVLSSVVCDDSPPGLVSKDSEQDLVAEASNTATQQAQKREATLSNSYGEPLPSDAYGPPSHIPIVPDLQSPAPVYGVPEFQNNQFNTPPGAYGPPSPITFPSQVYEGPPPPVGKPKPLYGPPKIHAPPKPIYGPPKPIYGPPKKNYGPPKQIFPKPIYGAPFKPQKINFPKPVYGPPKPVYGPPKPVYGPPKLLYGPPKQTYGAPINPVIPLQDLGPISLPPVTVHSNFGIGGGSFGNFGGISNDIDLGQNLPAPIYGTPINNVQIGSKPNFPIPSDHYGPPGLSLGPVGPNNQIVVEGFSNVGHYGPPQPDPNPRPPHPGIPAPPTPPHVLYDGWKPIPGVSKPIEHQHQHTEHHQHQQIEHHQHQQIEHHQHQQIEHHQPQHIEHVHHQQIEHHQHQHTEHVHHQQIEHYQPQHIEHDQHQHIEHHQHIDDHYGPPPPPPPPQIQEIHLDLEGHSLPSANQAHQFSGAQVSTGYSSVHQDALADIDLNAIVGGDSNHIDQSKTVFEAHYTENINDHGNSHQEDVILSAPSGHGKPFDTYGAPPVESLSNGPYPSSLRQQSGKVLIPPSGIYGVPPGGQYGAPPRPPPAHLPIPYGSFSGGGHTGGSTPRRPIKFRESVPDGLIQQIAHSTHHKDAHATDHLHQGPAYLPPPIRDVNDMSHQTGNHGVGLSLSIEPSNLFSLPHSGNPINFQGQQQPSNLYGSPIDSYSVPLFTVGDHTASGSNINEVKATVDSSIFANLSSSDVAAILKHCPYHEAILKAAKGGKIPADLASSYVASLSSLGTTLSKNKQVLISPQNGFNTPVPGSDSVSYNSKDLSSASHTLVQTILPSNDIKNDKTEKNTVQKGKSLKDDSGKHGFKQDNFLYVSDQIQQTSDKITKLSEETKKLQQKIVSTSENINQVSGQINQYANEIPITGNLGSYSLQIQSADGSMKGGVPSIPHDQLLSEGLLQSILAAIEQPSSPVKQMANPHFRQPNFNHNKYTSQSNINLSNADNDGLVLPAGYEPIDRTKEKNIASDQEIQASNKNIKQMLYKESHGHNHYHRGDIPPTDCDLKADNSIRHVIVVPPPERSIDNVQQVNDINENDVAIYFDEKSDEQSEPVTEISVATSISESVEKYADGKEFGDKINNKNKS